MTLSLDFRIAKSALVVQEDAECEIALTNRGDRPIQVVPPRWSSREPRLRVVEAKTGFERVHEIRTQDTRPGIERILKPGESFAGSFVLSHVVRFHTPGEFDLSALYSYESGKRTAESATVRLKISPSSARNLVLDSVQGSVVYGVWMNVAADPPEVMRSLLFVTPDGGVTETLSVGQGEFRSRPVPSVPPNGTDLFGHWIGWLDGTSLKFAHADDQLGVLALPPIDPPWSDVELVAPLVCDPVRDTSVRPNGSALLRSASGPHLRVLQLTPAGIRAAASGESQGERAAWMMSHVRSDGRRLVTAIRPSGNGLDLSRFSWSDAAIEPAVELAEWEGGFVGAAATMDFDDRIRGTLLRRDRGLLKLLSWSLAPDGGFEIGKETEILWSPKTAVTLAKMEVSSEGDSAVLLRDDQGRWFCHAQERLVPFPAKVATCRLAVDAAFLDDEPVLICAEQGSGFRILRLDGSSLPA